MERATVLHRARLALDLALGVVLAGLATLAIEVWIEYLTHPGISLLTAFERGREPWTAIGVWAVVGGASAALLVGTLIVLAEGSWIRRLLALAAVVIGAAWWLTAVGRIEYRGARGPDPATFAFAHPGVAALALLLPALVAALLVLTPHRERPTSRMGPVHRDDRAA